MKGVDISNHAGQTFELNGNRHFIKADLSDDIIDGDYDILIGGPPCKPWSSVNIRKKGAKHRDYYLLSRFFKHIKHHYPDIFLLENVPSVANDKIFRMFVKELKNEGYSIEGKSIIYSDFGAPTSRRRFFAFGIKRGNAVEFFRKIRQFEKPAKSVKDVIWDLKDVEKGAITDHEWPELKTIKKYMKYYKTGKYGWYILKWDDPAPSFGNIMKTYILHPDAFNGGDMRVISIREALLIMGFRSSFKFPKGIGLGHRYQMIVDAVSPVFSSIAAVTIKEMATEENPK